MILRASCEEHQGENDARDGFDFHGGRLGMAAEGEGAANVPLDEPGHRSYFEDGLSAILGVVH